MPPRTARSNSAPKMNGALSELEPFLQRLLLLARESGDVSPVAQELVAFQGLARFAPTVDLEKPVQTLALELGRLISRQRSRAGKHVFVRDGSVVTLDETTAQIQAMTASRFVSWIEEFCAFTGGHRRSRPSLTRDEAAQVLTADVFLACLRPLRAVHSMRLPVMREGQKLAFLPSGYDEETGIFTCDLVPYSMEWNVDQARAWFLDVCGELPWNGKEENPNLEENRNLAVHVALTVGNYCHALFPEGTLRPMIAYLANKPGTGKTRAAEMSLAHVHGFVGGATAPKDEEKMDVKLETIARAQRAFVLFDDVGLALRSNALNKFLTESRHTGRCYHSNSEFFDVPNVTQVIATANDLQTSEDLGRRALIAEMFLSEEVRGRKFRRVITPQWLALPETRASFLAACCAIVRHWAETEVDEGCLMRHLEPLETFETWTGIVGAMVINAGFADPLARTEVYVCAGDENEEIKRLLILAATEREGDCELSRKDLIELARAHGLIEGTVGMKGDAEPDAGANKSLGRKLQRWRGQRLCTLDGRRFQFGKKHTKSGVSYVVVFLRPSTEIALLERAGARTDVPNRSL